MYSNHFSALITKSVELKQDISCHTKQWRIVMVLNGNALRSCLCVCVCVSTQVAGNRSPGLHVYASKHDLLYLSKIKCRLAVE